MVKMERAILEQAFVEPIRFALLVDDKFPAYTSLANDGKLDPELDNDRAKKLFSFIREKGWLCDVDNRGDVSDSFEEQKHLSQSDLLILDFNLNPLDQNDPTKALTLLQRLSASENFNLVILYTAAADPDWVARDIAFALGAGAEVNSAIRDEVQIAVENLGEEIDAIESELSQTVIDEYLSGSGPKASANSLRTQLKDAGIATEIQQVILYLAHRRMSARVKPQVLGRRQRHTDLQSSVGKAGVRWVAAGNVFIAVVSKDEEPQALVDRLLEALGAWNPKPLQVMLTHARATIEKTGRLSDQEVLASARLQAGWFLHILHGQKLDERKASITELYARLLEGLTRKIEPSISAFGLQLIEIVRDLNPVSAAKELAHADGTLEDVHVYHALNQFVSSEPCPDGPMTPGIIFREESSTESYWLCTSPACDLIPGQNRRGWEGQLKPLRFISMARLKPSWNVEAIGLALNDATQGRHLFVVENDKPIVLEVMGSISRQMDLEIALLENDALVKDGGFAGHLISVASEMPALNRKKFIALAKLRSDYANRLLAQVGHQRSRIGVDFFDFKTQKELP